MASGPRSASSVAVVLAVLLGAGLAPLAQADHQQSLPNGDVVRFTKVSGNEWWVQVQMGGPDGHRATAVRAMDTGGPWVTLKQQTWTADRTWWAASFHIEPGNQVRFRADFPGGTQNFESCWFDHPSGTERCGAPPPPPPPPPPPGGFAATFKQVSGNNWWEEVVVSANKPLAGVDVRVQCSSMTAMTQRADWGKWVSGTHIPTGSKVDFRARATDGSVAFSGGYLWPSATPTTACSPPPPPPPPPPTFPPEGLHLGPSNDPRYGVTIAWHIAGADANQAVDIGQTPAYGRRVAATPSTTPDSSGTSYHAIIGALLPDTVYHYRVGSGDAWSGDRSFRTAPVDRLDRTVRVGVTGDTGVSPDAATIIGHIGNASLDAIIHTGDHAYAADAWAAYLEQWAPAASTSLFLSAVGNHDVEACCARASFSSSFVLPNNERWWSSNIGNLHIVVLDSEPDSGDGNHFPDDTNVFTSPSPQMTWLANDLATASTTGRYIVVDLHRPMYSSNNVHPSNIGIRAALEPLLDQYGVDLVVSGHAHAYERTFPVLGDVGQNNHTSQYTRGDGPIHVVTGGGGRPVYDDWGAMPNWTATREATHHWVELVAETDGSLKVQTHRTSDGAIIDAFSIVSPPPGDPPVANFTMTIDGLRIHVDGSASTDDGGRPLSYTWSFGDGTVAHGVTADHMFTSPGDYLINLTVHDGTFSHSHVKLGQVNAPPGPSLVHAITGPSVGRADFAKFEGTAIALADFRGDGRLQAVAQNDDGNVYVVDPATGMLLAALVPGNAGCTQVCYDYEGISGPISAPVVADVDGTGRLTVIATSTSAVVTMFRFDPSSSTNTQFVFDKTFERRFNDYQSFSTIDATPVLHDLTGDGNPEIVLAIEQNGMFAVRGDGSILWQRSISGGHGTPAAGDLDNDGIPEVVVGNDAGTVYALHGRTGATLWQRSAGTWVQPGSISAGPTLADLNGDGKKDILVMARDAHDAHDYGNDHAMILAYDHAGSLLWTAQPAWGAPLSHTRMVVQELDGQTVVLGATWNTIGHHPGNFERVGPGHVFLYTAEGQEIWHQPLDVPSSATELVVADVVGDGTQQVLVECTRSAVAGACAFNMADGALKAFLATEPYQVTRGAVVGELFHDGRTGIIIPVDDDGVGALNVYRAEHPVDTTFPGWGAITIPHGSSTPPAVPVQKEGESFGTRTAGGRQAQASASGGAVWNLWSNGHIQDTLTSTSPGTLSVVARGDPLGGVWPTMVVSVDGIVVKTMSVTSRTLTSYAISELTPGPHTIRIAFTNDALSSSEDRNLIIDVVRWTPSSGGGDGAWTLTAGQSTTWEFDWIGGPGHFVVNAATANVNLGPTLRTEIDGAVVREAPVAGPVARPAWNAFELPAGTHIVRFTALDDTIQLSAPTVSAAAPPTSFTAASARVHEGGTASGSGWRFTDFGYLESRLVVQNSGWYRLRVEGTGTVSDVGPLVHLWLNRTVVAEKVQGTTIDVSSPEYLVGGVGYTLGASFENPWPGRTARFNFLSATPAAPPVELPPPVSVDPKSDPAGWPTYGRDSYNSRSIDDATLPDHGNVGDMTLAWRANLDGSVTGTPAVVDGRLYVGTWGKSFYALDADTGAVLWRTSVPSVVDGSAAVAGGLVVFANGDRFTALNASTGTEVWSTTFGGRSWSSPTIDGDHVFVGIGFGRGYVARLALNNGTIEWVTPTTEIENGGARVWASPLVAPGSGLVIVGTSPGGVGGQGPTIDSLMAFDRDDGSIVWVRQLFPRDLNREETPEETLLENRDISGTPHLATLDGRPVILASQKHGQAWTVDLSTGTVIHGGRLLESRAALVGSGGVSEGVRVVSSSEPDRVAGFDLATGDLLWQQQMPSTEFAPVAIANGIVWIGSWEGHLHAFDLHTGASLTQLEAGGGVLGGASMANGTVFVGALEIPASGRFFDSLGALPGSVSAWRVAPEVPP